MTPAQRLRRRTYGRLYARRRREARYAAERLHARRCPKRWGRHPCGGPLETRTDGLGRTVVVCLWCERHARGLCQDCPRPVRGKSKRCEPCKHRALRESGRRHVARHHTAILARARAFYPRDPAERARRNAVKRAWRKVHREQTQAQKRRAALRQLRRVKTYGDRYRTRYREHYRQQARDRYYRDHPTRPDARCEVCGADVDWTGTGRPAKRCDAHVYPSIRRAREARRAHRAAAASPAPLPLRPAKVRRPPTAVALPDGRHRCVGVRCEAILTGRAKKCPACKAREAREAEQLLRVLTKDRWPRRRAA